MMRLLMRLSFALLALLPMTWPACAEDGASRALQQAFAQWEQPLLATGANLQQLADGGNSGCAAANAAESNIRPAPLRVAQSETRFHGVHLDLLVYDDATKQFSIRPLDAISAPGERFKLRVLASFAGEVTVDNINPQWRRKRVYPLDAREHCLLTAGKQVLIPPGRDEFFQFAAEAGEDRLIVSVQDASAEGKGHSQAKVYRFENPDGVDLLQAVSFDTLTAISGSLKLRHD